MRGVVLAREVATVIEFLLPEGASYITGHVCNVDEGIDQQLSMGLGYDWTGMGWCGWQ